MKENIREEIDQKTSQNMIYVKELFKDNSDMVFREFKIGSFSGGLVYIDGMADKDLLNDFLLEPLMENANESTTPQQLKDKIIAISDMKEIKKLSDGINAVLSGETLVFIDDLGAAFTIANRAWPNRGIGEPSGETVIRGSREGFTETIRFNTALVRRRIKDTRLKIEASKAGKRSKTDLAIMYIEDIVNNEVLEELKLRLKDINLDAVLDSGYVEQYIEDSSTTPFPQVQSTERPDVVAAALYEGRVAILVDNSPFALIVPAVLASFFQSPDDYYNRWMSGSVVRIIRLFAIVASLMLPAFYVAVTTYQTGIIPTKLAYAIAASREGVPFAAYVEALLMEAALAFLIEAIIKLPKPVGSTIGIVGGLIIGQSAVSAGLVSPIMVIVLGLTAITTFLIPNYTVTTAFSYFRILFILMAAILGLYGIMLGFILLLIHLTRIESFGIPYLAPAVDLVASDLKDLYIRMPLKMFKKRPEFLEPGDKIRQK